MILFSCSRIFSFSYIKFSILFLAHTINSAFGAVYGLSFEKQTKSSFESVILQPGTPPCVNFQGAGEISAGKMSTLYILY